MRLLLDTHVLIWWDEGAKLSARAAEAIRSADQVFVSAVMGWEIAIKASLGRIRPRRSVARAIAECGFEELPVFLKHTEAVGALRWHHKDPFDRLLAAQAATERLSLVTRDPSFQAYGLRLIRA